MSYVLVPSRDFNPYPYFYRIVKTGKNGNDKETFHCQLCGSSYASKNSCHLSNHLVLHHRSKIRLPAKYDGVDFKAKSSSKRRSSTCGRRSTSPRSAELRRTPVAKRHRQSTSSTAATIPLLPHRHVESPLKSATGLADESSEEVISRSTTLTPKQCSRARSPGRVCPSDISEGLQRSKQMRLSCYFPPVPSAYAVKAFQQKMVKVFLAKKTDPTILCDAGFRKAMDAIVPSYSTIKDTAWEPNEISLIAESVRCDTQNAGIHKLLVEIKLSPYKVVSLVLNAWPRRSQDDGSHELITISAAHASMISEGEPILKPTPIAAMPMKGMTDEQLVKNILRDVCRSLLSNGIEIIFVVGNEKVAGVRDRLSEELNVGTLQPGSTTANVKNAEFKCMPLPCLVEMNDSLMEELMDNQFSSWVEAHRRMQAFVKAVKIVAPELVQPSIGRLLADETKDCRSPSTFVDWLDEVSDKWEDVKNFLSDAGALAVWRRLDGENRSLHDALSKFFFSADNNLQVIESCEPLKILRDVGNRTLQHSFFVSLSDIDEAYRKVAKVATLEESSKVLVLAKLSEVLEGKAFLLRYHKHKATAGIHLNAVAMFEKTLEEAVLFNIKYPSLKLNLDGARDTLAHYFKNGGCHSRSKNMQDYMLRMTGLEYWDLHSGCDDVAKFIYATHAGIANVRSAYAQLAALDSAPDMETFTTIMISHAEKDQSMIHSNDTHDTSHSCIDLED